MAAEYFSRCYSPSNPSLTDEPPEVEKRWEKIDQAVSNAVLKAPDCETEDETASEEVWPLKIHVEM